MVYAVPPQQPAPRRRKIWPWVLLGVGVAVVVVIAVCAGLLGKGITDAVKEGDKKDAATTDARTASCKGKTYPDRQPKNDICANPAGLVSLAGVQISAAPLRRAGTAVCSAVTYVNTSKATVDFNEFDWKLQTPSGEVLGAFDSPAGGPPPLGSGALIAGGKKTGAVCYEAAAKGPHVLIYKPSFWDDARGIWLAAL